MGKFIQWSVVATLLVAVPALAQESGSSSFQTLLQAIRLPTVTKEARTLGVPEQDLQSIFGTARTQRVSAGSLADLLSNENDAIREHGPIDNFGAFVQEKLNAGLRGRDLAAAIHAEHAARGMGKGHSMAPGKSGDHPGASGSAGMPGMSGENTGKPASPGKSGEAGKSGDAGKKGGK